MFITHESHTVSNRTDHRNIYIIILTRFQLKLPNIALCALHYCTVHCINEITNQGSMEIFNDFT